MIVPDTLNGWPVVASDVHLEMATVIVQRESVPHPFVVATWWPGLGGTWMWGHYEPTRHSANKLFVEITERRRARDARVNLVGDHF